MKKILLLCLSVAAYSCAVAQPATDKNAYYIDNDSMMMTVFLRHQQQQPVDSIQGKVMQQHFYEKIGNSHARILSWNVVMGIGQIITLKCKPQYIREVNQVFESGAWGGFNTEFYPTYDFLPVYPQMKAKEQKATSKQ